MTSQAGKSATDLTRRTVNGQEETYRYDNACNLLQDANNTYEYDAFRRTSKVTTKTGLTQINRYDAEGLRCEMEENGKLVQFIFNENKEVITEQEGENITRLIRTSDLWAMEANPEKTWYHYASDEQGSTVFITGKNGEVKNRYSYDAFGNTIESEEQIPNRYQYTGQQLDSITQQYYLRARFYNPAIAKFTQEDEYHGDGLNLYAYCANNPVDYYDPSGYNVCEKKYKLYQQYRKEGFNATDAYAKVKGERLKMFSPSRKSGHHVPAVKKSEGRVFEVLRSDKDRPTFFLNGSDEVAGRNHWRLHHAEEPYIGPRNQKFVGDDKRLMEGYKKAYRGMENISVDVKSPKGNIIAKNVTPEKGVEIMEKWLKNNRLWK